VTGLVVCRATGRRTLLAAVLLVLAGCGSGQGTQSTSSPRTPDIAPETPTAASAPPTSTPTPLGIPAGESWIAIQSNGLIHLVRPDGSGDHAPFPVIAGGEQFHPDWSPDGDHLSWTIRGTTDVIWVGYVDGSNPRLLVDCQAPCVRADEAAWSPDGRSLIFQRMVDRDGVGVSTLELVDVETGTSRVVLAAQPAHAFYQPRWSGDGTRVVTEYATTADASADSEIVGVALAVVDVTATSPVVRPITKASDLTNSPDWSWATGRIVFAQPSTAQGFDGPSDLVVIRPDGTGSRHVRSVDDQTPQPAWSPDGSRILYLEPDSTPWTVAQDGTDPQPAISGGSYPGGHPRYRPTH
jgi:WD40-like Beta Propeller Repeat